MASAPLRLILLAAGVAAVLLILPAASMGATFTVNDDSDEPDLDGNVAGNPGPNDDPTWDGSCDIDGGTSGQQCSLRAALAEAEATIAADTIQFDTTMTGLGADPTITVGADNGHETFPSIFQPVTIDGCVLEDPNSAGPCVGVRCPGNGACFGSARGFWFNAGNSAVRGLALTGFGTALQYSGIFNSSSLQVQNNWFGTKLDGSVEKNFSIGLEISGGNVTVGGPDGATGTSPADRNVFSNNGFDSSFGVGVRISDGLLGASTDDNNRIQGNYFGVEPDGTTAGTTATSDLIILGNDPSNPAPTPEGTVIGGTVSTAAAATSACDDVCNVFGDSDARAIDLSSQLISYGTSGSATIAGNFIGMTAAGDAAVSAPVAIRALGAPALTVGGAAAGARNFIRATGTAVSSSSTGNADAVIRNNYIGLGSDGETLSPPQVGAALNSDSADPATVAGNRIAATTTGLDLTSGSNAAIEDNVLGIEGDGDTTSSGTNAIRLAGVSSFTVDGNTVSNASGDGVRIQGGGDHILTGNFIGTDSGGNDRGNVGSGVEITDLTGTPSTGNQVGGSDAASENVIANNLLDAITVTTDGSDGNTIARNHGAGNGGPFIDLNDDNIGNPPDGPNEGIGAPTVTLAGATHAAGTAIDGATVRVYRKANGTAGEINSFLGSAVAAGGSWQLTYGAAVPDMTRVVATQTDTSGNSSELSDIVDTDGVAPAVSIASGPSGPTGDSTPTFGFSAEAGSTIECLVDGSPVACSGAASHTTAALADGPHSFQVRATDANLNAATASRNFSVDTDAPEARIVKGPKRRSDRTPTFRLAADDPTATLECKLDRAPFKRCPKRYTTKRLRPGRHKLTVRAKDAVGNVDPVPAVKRFRIAR